MNGGRQPIGLLQSIVVSYLRWIRRAVICALFLVDVIGRKRALILGITLQAISIVYIAGFLPAAPDMGVVEGFKLPATEKRASEVAIAMDYLSGFGWALGWNSMQYLLESMDRLFALP